MRKIIYWCIMLCHVIFCCGACAKKENRAINPTLNSISTTTSSTSVVDSPNKKTHISERNKLIIFIALFFTATFIIIAVTRKKMEQINNKIYIPLPDNEQAAK
ncbi:MAG: hypothetical protein LBN01_02275 [Endomicrobium sp.]|nr:hypothetical protein [Endomicrobium sp.]